MSEVNWSRSFLPEKWCDDDDGEMDYADLVFDDVYYYVEEGEFVDIDVNGTTLRFHRVYNGIDEETGQYFPEEDGTAPCDICGQDCEWVCDSTYAYICSIGCMEKMETPNLDMTRLDELLNRYEPPED